MTEQQNFIGAIVAKALAKKGVEVAIEKGMEKIARRTDVALDKADVPVATAVVTKAITDEVQARVEHVTDTEPHLSSRNVWGSFVGIITAVETIRIFWTDGQPQSVQEWLVPIGIIIAALTPLYSRFVAKKPLFR